MKNSEAFQFFCQYKSHSYRSIADQFIISFGFEQSDMNLFRLKFNDIQKERDLFTKNSDLDTCNSMYFCHIPKVPELSSTSTISFEEDLNITKIKTIGDLTTKALRNRLYCLKSYLELLLRMKVYLLRLLLIISYFFAPMKTSTLLVLGFAKR